MRVTPDTHVDGGNRTVELYVRSLAPRATHDHQEGLVGRLERLRSRGCILDYTVHVWGSRIDLSSAAARTDAGRFIRRRVEEFSEWASESELSTGSFFEEEPVRSSITGEEYTATVLPTAALAEYVDEELAFVTPCTDGDTVYTVTDRLEELASARPASDDAELAGTGN